MVRFTSIHDLDATEGVVQLRQNLDSLVGGTHGKDTLVLHPRPSPTDPNDPLRWPRWRKHMAFFAVCSFVFLTNFGISAVAPAFPTIAREFHVDQETTSQLAILPLLILGVGNFFWVPVANTVGRRPMFVFTTAVYAAAQAWGAGATSFHSLFCSVMLACTVGSSNEALGAAMVNDIYFLHERSGKMSVYIAAISTGNAVGPLVCGFMVETVGWRWYKGLAAILVGVNCLLVLFFVPETRYLERDLSHEGDTLEMTRSTSSPDSGHSSDPEKTGASVATAPSTDLKGAESIPKKTYWQSLSLWPGIPPNTTPVTILKGFIRPFPLMVFPAAIYSTLAIGIALGWVISASTLLPFILQAPPYNFNAGIVGLMNVPNLLGNLLGAFVGGWCVDRYTDWAARRNAGVFVPEMRLHLLPITTVLTPAGLVLLGYGVGLHLHWASVAFGFGMLAFSLTAVSSPTLTYVSDSLLPVQTDALLLVTAVKNVIAFGISYAVVPWSKKAGYIDFYGTQAGLFVAVVGLGGLAVWWLGDAARRSMGRWKVVLV